MSDEPELKQIEEHAEFCGYVTNKSAKQYSSRFKMEHMCAFSMFGWTEGKRCSLSEYLESVNAAMNAEIG